MFTQVSTEPIPGGQEIRNGGFGNRCVICLPDKKPETSH